MARHDLVLPEMDMGDQPLVASLWLVRVGDRVAEGEQILEVLAGPATVDLPAPAEGRLVETLVSEDDTLTAGQRLAVIESDE